jgi:hypothetical protein
MAGFFDTFLDTGNAGFVGKDEKEELIADSTPLEVKGVELRKETQYGDQYFMLVNLDGEDRIITFSVGTVQSRDRMLDAMATYLSADEAVSPRVRLEKAGRAVLVVNADQN